MSVFPKDEEPTYQDYVSKFLEYEETGEGSLWQRGDLLVEFIHQPSLALLDESGARVKSLRAFASDVMRHHKTLDRWYHTALTFHHLDRVLDLSFSHHMICAYSKKPKYWLKQAADNEWSTHQLRQAIAAAEGPEKAWVGKRVHGSADLRVEEMGDCEAVHLHGEDFVIVFPAKEGDPIRFGEVLGGIIGNVEVEARIRIRRK